MCVRARSWRRVGCGTSIMTSIFSFMKYQGHGSKLSPSFKMTKLVVLKAEVSSRCPCATAAHGSSVW